MILLPILIILLTIPAVALVRMKRRRYVMLDKDVRIEWRRR